MRLPSVLRRLDDRALPRRGRDGTDEAGEDAGAGPDRRSPPAPARRGRGDGPAQVLRVVYRVSRTVLLLLALACALGVVFVLAPTNPDNVVVDTVLRLADAVAGIFRDVFAVPDDRERELVVNYGFAALVYLLLAALVGRLPTGGART